MTSKLNRRETLAMAGLLGASIAWPRGASASALKPIVSGTAFPQGVASADPTSSSVILWTRSPSVERLVAEVSEDCAFNRVVATANAAPSAATDWTCRVLVAGLKPGRTYWYRFVNDEGQASRTGRTCTAPDERADRPVRFAFVSCQNLNLGHATPYRRMIVEDEKRPDSEQIEFILHLGDFIYELIWYPEDRPEGRFLGRTLRDVVRLPSGVKVGEYHVPSSLEDYRAVYRAYLSDPHIQDARARWPFVCVWDNHEFTSRGWQSQAVYDTGRAAQRLKVDANRAWFEYIPARVRKAGADDRFAPPAVQDTPLNRFDRNGLSQEPNNLAAIGSLLIARSLRWGRNVELILTDNRSFRSQPVFDSDDAAPFKTSVPMFAPQQVVEVLDAGRTYAGGKPPETISFGGKDLPNPRQGAGPGSMLGAEQKAWFLRTLRQSSARWKLWGNSVGMLDVRADLSNLPSEQARSWPIDGLAAMYTHDWCGYPTERTEILEAVADAGVTNFVSLVGDRHAFFAGLLSPALPPNNFTPVGAEFVVGAISTPTSAGTARASLPASHPLASLYLQGEDRKPALNMTVLHGVRSSLAHAQTGKLDAALAVRNPDVAPHLAFADLDGYGYAVVRAKSDTLDVEFVAVEEPMSASADKVVYRVVHRVDAWKRDQRPALRRLSAEGAELQNRFALKEP